MNQYKMNKSDSLYIQRELEKIQQKIAPFMKKSGMFALVSIPLISFSLITLFLLLFHVGLSQEVVVVTVLIAIAAAFGFALLKESMHQNKIIYKVSFEYMAERIAKSKTLPDSSKEAYLEKLHTQPVNAMNSFYEFLKHEEKVKN